MRLLISVLLVIFVPLLVQEFGELASWMAERLLQWGTGWLPREYRQQYEQDWIGELDVIPGKITKLVFAFRVLVRVPATQRALSGRDAIWVLVTKRVLALLITGVLAVLQFLIRLGDRLPRRASERALRRRVEAEVPAALAQEARILKMIRSTLWKDLANSGATVKGTSKGVEVMFVSHASPKDLVSPTMPLNLTTLPPRTVNVLRRAGIRTYEDLVNRYAEQGERGMLGRIRDFGRRDMDEVTRLLHEDIVDPDKGGL